MYDVVVVGGGPIGLFVAERTAEAGFRTIVLEEDMKVGRPVQCAGLVSPRVVQMSGTDKVVSRENSATIHPPNGPSLKIEAMSEKACIIDRGGFDREMAKKAVNAGAEIEVGAKVVDVGGDENRWVEFRKEGRKRKIEASVIVGADGPSSVVRKKAGLPGPQELLPGIQAVVPSSANGVQIFLGSDVAPDFFGWEVPYVSGSVVGLASSSGSYEKLQRLLKRLGKGNKVMGIQAGTIPLGRMKKSVKDGIVLVGDSACQVKPLSGGGLYTGLKSAEHCADVLVSALEEGDVSEKRLKEYHKRWSKDVGKEIGKGMWMRKIFRDFSDSDLDNLIEAMTEPKIKRIIEERGDLDYPSRLAKPVLKTSPKLLKFAGPMIKNIF